MKLKNKKNKKNKKVQNNEVIVKMKIERKPLFIKNEIKPEEKENDKKEPEKVN